MKAVVMHKRGGPEVLKYQDFPRPEIGPDEVLVRVRACALNHLDIFTRAGKQGVKAPLPHILGLEVAGDIAEIGEAVEEVSPGDRVLIAPFFNCGQCEFCRTGRENLCPKLRILGVTVHGGYAEYAKAPGRYVIPIGDLPYEDAAGTPSAFGTAWHMLVTRARIQEGETVLVLAAGSGVGTGAIQVAKYFNCRVIATASTDEKLAKAKELGADDLINYAEEGFHHAVRGLTDGRGVDIVFEHVGTDTWEKSMASLVPGGRIVTCGSTTGRWGRTDLWSLFGKQVTILGSYGATVEDLRQVSSLVASHRFKAIIDRTFPLEEAAAAHEYMAERRQFGKIVLIP